MAIEIERKFLIVGDDWRSLAPGILYRQGYLPSKNFTTLRVRIAGDRGFITIKGQNTGRSRLEFEYAIPLADAQQLLDNLCATPQITKYRYSIPWRGVVWEVDEFLAENQGLIVAEVELATEDQTIDLPPWIGKEVTGDAKYYNVNLVERPFCDWS